MALKLFWLPICLPFIFSNLTPQPSTPGLKEDFLNALEQLRRAKKIPGLSVAVVKNGDLYLAEGLGIADLETGIPTKADTPFPIASVTKPLSAVLMMVLVEKGLIDLDQPIATYSDWEGFCEAFSQQPSIFAKGLNCDPPVHTLRHLLTHTATGKPGRFFSYNPILFSWASRPVAAKLKQPFSTQFHDLILKPLGMQQSARKHRALVLPKPIQATLAPPHRLNSSGVMVRAPKLKPQGDGAAGGLVSTVLDLATFDMALDQGKLISKQARMAMMQPYLNHEGEPLPYGLGWFIEDYNNVRLVWHSGWWEKAYSSLYLKVPSQNLTLILLANSEGIWWQNPLDSAAVHQSVFANLFLDHFLKPAAKTQ